jgi:hypothetical protein
MRDEHAKQLLCERTGAGVCESEDGDPEPATYDLMFRILQRESGPSARAHGAGCFTFE